MLLPTERFPGAEGGDGVDDGGGEHVGEAAGNREAFFNEAPDDRDDCAFADREDDAEDTAEEDGAVFVAGEGSLEGVGGEIDVDEPADEGAEEDEWSALAKDRQEGDREILKCILAHGREQSLVTTARQRGGSGESVDHWG